MKVLKKINRKYKAIREFLYPSYPIIATSKMGGNTHIGFYIKDGWRVEIEYFDDFIWYRFLKKDKCRILSFDYKGECSNVPNLSVEDSNRYIDCFISRQQDSVKKCCLSFFKKTL